jgi:hypothetical protein
MEGVMTTRRLVWLLNSVACLTMLAYLGLVVLAAGCVSMPVLSSGPHHHSQEPPHSSLCAWSCQMMSQSGLVPTESPAVISFVAISVVRPLRSFYPVTPSALYPSRAPPFPSVGNVVLG